MKPAGEIPGADDAVESAAAEWLVRRDRGLTAKDQDEFLQWLAASSTHREAFRRHQQMWIGFNALAQWRPEHSAAPNPDLLARPRRAPRLHWWAPVLGAAAAVALILWWAPPVQTVDDDAVDFEAASYRQETLPDGTVVDLNRGAHVVLQYSPGERRVLLVQGEAQFTVARNPARPFVVRAGGVDVRAVGTAFNVKLDGANLEVLVTEGTVHVAQNPAAPGSPTPDAGRQPPAPAAVVRLSAGQRTVISVAPAPVDPVVLPASREEIERLLEWQPRLLDFDFTPLSDVVATFNRRNRVQLVIGDTEIGAMPIVASIRSDNVEGFVRLLEATMGVGADRRSLHEIVLHRAR